MPEAETGSIVVDCSGCGTVGCTVQTAETSCCQCEMGDDFGHWCDGCRTDYIDRMVE